MTDPCDLTAVEARRVISARQMSPVELVTSCLERIEDLNPTLNAVVTVARESALAEAQRAEKALLQGLEELHLQHKLKLLMSQERKVPKE